MGNHNRRPLKFWEVFNKWWRGELDSLGRRPCASEIINWYESHAAEVWLPGVRPTVQETRMHAKCLRSLDGVRSYFKRYRRGKRNGTDKDVSSDDESEAISHEPSPRKYRARPVKVETATSSAERSAATTVFTSPKSTSDAWNASTKPPPAIPPLTPAAGSTTIESAPTSLPILSHTGDNGSRNLLEDATVPSGSKRPRASDPTSPPATKTNTIRSLVPVKVELDAQACPSQSAPLPGLPAIPLIRTEGQATSQLTWLLASPRAIIMTPRGPTPVGGGDDGDDVHIDALLCELGDGLATPFKGAFPWSSRGIDSPLGLPVHVLPWVAAQDDQAGIPSNTDNAPTGPDHTWPPQLKPTIISYGSGDWLSNLVDGKPSAPTDHHLLTHRTSAPMNLHAAAGTGLPRTDHASGSVNTMHFMGPSVSSPVSSALARWSARDSTASGMLHATNSYPGPLRALANARGQETLATVQPQHVLRNNMVVTLPSAPLPPQSRAQLNGMPYWVNGPSSLPPTSGNAANPSMSAFTRVHQASLQSAQTLKSQPSLPPFPFPSTTLLSTGSGPLPSQPHSSLLAMQASAPLPQPQASGLDADPLWQADLSRSSLPLNQTLINNKVKQTMGDMQTHARQSTTVIGATTASRLASQLGGVLTADPLPMLPLSHKFNHEGVDMGAPSNIGQSLQHRMSWPLAH